MNEQSRCSSKKLDSYHSSTKSTKVLSKEEWIIRKCPIAPVSIPILEWLPLYTKENFFKDLIAGLTVFVFLVPQGMAYAILSGLPAVYGLYSATIPLFIFAIFSTSKQVAMGPMAVTSLLLGVTCQKYGYDDGTPEYITIAMSVSMMIGFILIFLGLGRLGSLSNLISHSVLVGFLTASALVIAITQLKYIFGIKMPRFPYSHQTIAYIATHLNETNKNAVLLGLGMTAMLIIVREWKKRNKVTTNSSMWIRIIGVFANLSNFLSIVIGSFIAQGIISNGGDIQIVGNVPSGLKSPQLNIVSLSQWIGMIPASCAIAFVSFAGNWAVAVKYAQINKYRVEATQELIASGLAIVVGVFFNSFVVSGGLARTAVNAESGATTQMSMCICAILILISLLVLTSFFYYIPMCVLSAVIEVSVISMVDFESMLKAYMIDKRDCMVMVITFLITFFLGITEGLFVGIFLSVAVVMQTTAFPHIVHIGKLPTAEGGYYRDISRYPEAEQIPGYAIVRMDASPLFSNCNHFKEVVLAAAGGKYHAHQDTIHTVVIDASAWIDMDLMGVQTMLGIKEELKKLNNTHIAIACAKGIIRDRLRESNFATGMERHCFYFSIDDAIHGRPMTGHSLVLNDEFAEKNNDDCPSHQYDTVNSPFAHDILLSQKPVQNQINASDNNYSILHGSNISSEDDQPPSF